MSCRTWLAAGDRFQPLPLPRVFMRCGKLFKSKSAQMLRGFKFPGRFALYAHAFPSCARSRKCEKFPTYTVPIVPVGTKLAEGCKVASSPDLTHSFVDQSCDLGLGGLGIRLVVRLNVLANTQPSLHPFHNLHSNKSNKSNRSDKFPLACRPFWRTRWSPRYPPLGPAPTLPSAWLTRTPWRGGSGRSLSPSASSNPER